MLYSSVVASESQSMLKIADFIRQNSFLLEHAGRTTHQCGTRRHSIGCLLFIWSNLWELEADDAAMNVLKKFKLSDELALLRPQTIHS